MGEAIHLASAASNCMHTLNFGKITSTFVLPYKHFEQDLANEMEWWEGGAEIRFSGGVRERNCLSKKMKSFVGVAVSPFMFTPVFVNSLLHIVEDLARK
jgi:hypothetical protein